MDTSTSPLRPADDPASIEHGDLLPPPDAPTTPVSTGRMVWHGVVGMALGAGLTFGGMEAAEALAIDWRAIFPRDVGLLGILLGILAVLLALWLHVLIHEAGHAMAGLAGGLRPLAFGVGPIRLERAEAGWRFRWGGGLSGISGFAALLPPADRPPSRSVQAAYLLGGVAANAIVAALALQFVPSSEPGFLRGFWMAMAAAGVFLAVVNLIPFRSEGWLSDGAGLWSLWRQPGLAFASMALQQVVQASMDGVRPRDWPTALLPADDAPFGNYGDPVLDAGSAAMRLSRALDAGDAERAEAAARFLRSAWPAISPAQRPGVAVTLAVHCLLIRKDLVAVRAWRERMAGSLFDMRCHEAWLDAEIAWGDGDLVHAQLKLDEAIAALPRVHDAGTRTVVAERLDRLATRLAAAVAP